MNARGTNEEVFACVLTCGVRRERTTEGEKTRGDRGRAGARDVQTEGGGRECAARIRLAVRLSTREETRERLVPRACGSASGKSFGRAVAPARGAGKVQRGLKSVAARCTCPDAGSYNVHETPGRAFLRRRLLRPIFVITNLVRAEREAPR